MKDLGHKPENGTTEESFEEILKGLEEEVEKTDKKILRYKEKIKGFSVQD